MVQDDRGEMIMTTDKTEEMGIMKRKSIAAVLLVAALGLTACGGQSADVSQADTQEAQNGEADGEQGEEADGDGIIATDDFVVTKPEEGTQLDPGFSVESGNIPEITIEAKQIPDKECFQFVKDMKTGWNLGNTLEAYSQGKMYGDDTSSEESWGNPVTTREMIDTLKNAGFRTVRIPVTWHNHVTDDGNGPVISEAWLDRVQEVVDYAYDNGMYVILNTHHDNTANIEGEGGYYPDTAHAEESDRYIKGIWTQVAERFKDYDEHLIFESLNEPRLVGTNYEWNFNAGVAECKDAAESINRLNQLFVDTVRATGGNNVERYLMMPGYDASLAGAITDLYQLPNDIVSDKLIVSVHAYTPYNFALRPESESEATDYFSWEDPQSVYEIDDLMNSLYNKFVSKGIPVVIGEYGAMNRDNNTQDRVDYYAYYTAAARANGITCCVWDNGSFTDGEIFGILRRRVNKWFFEETVEAMMKYS